VTPTLEVTDLNVRFAIGHGGTDDGGRGAA
jgi:hypothetical protein